MADWHGYLAIQDANNGTYATIPNEQRVAIWQGFFAALGQDDNSPQPARRMQVRTSLDSNIRIFEAVFDTDNLSVASVRTIIRNAFGGLLASEVVPTTNSITIDTKASRFVEYIITDGATLHRLRFGAFGDLDATWEQSRKEAAAYIVANDTNWNETT